jgi:uncharacterized membrane protein (DUF106 family)
MSSVSFGEMEIMWLLMIIMFGWNLYMVYQHNRLKKKVECHCGSHPCVKCESGSH